VSFGLVAMLTGEGLEEATLAGHAAEGGETDQAERVLIPTTMGDANILAFTVTAN